jgi:hypothetical protein
VEPGQPELARPGISAPWNSVLGGSDATAAEIKEVFDLIAG